MTKPLDHLERAFKILHPNAMRLIATPGTDPKNPKQDEYLCRDKKTAEKEAKELENVYEIIRIENLV